MLRALAGLLLMVVAARAADDAAAQAARLIAAVNSGDEQAVRALCHRFEAREWHPWEIKALLAQVGQEKFKLGEARAPLVSGGRAVVEIARDPPGARVFAWLGKAQGRWGFVGWRQRLSISKEWLYEKGKRGTAARPEDAADAYLKAIADGDRDAAEKHCTLVAWTRGKFNLGQVFTNTRKAEAELRRVAFSQHGRRAFVLVEVVIDAKVRGEFFFLVQKRGSSWLLASVVEKREQADEFLIGKPWPFDPTTAQALRSRFVEAVRERAYWRVRRLTTGACWGMETVQETYRAATEVLHSLDYGGEVAVQGRRGTARLRIVKRALGQSEAKGLAILLLVKSLYGWRVDGVTADEAFASKYLEGQVPAPR